MPTGYIIGHKNDFQPSDRTIHTAADSFKLDNEFGAIDNPCPHYLALLRQGDLTDLVTAEDIDHETHLYKRPGDIVTCPWHDGGFGSRLAESRFNPHIKTRIYDVERKHTAQNHEHPLRMKYLIQLAGDELPVEPHEIKWKIKTTLSMSDRDGRGAGLSHRRPRHEWNRNAPTWRPVGECERHDSDG